MATASLERKIGRARVETLNNMLAEGNFKPVFTYLLHNYYDPLYKYPEEPSPEFDLCVDTTNITKAIDNIFDFLKEL
jgi:tRNA 2-selenouridine synthase